MQQRYYDPQIGRFLSNDPVSTNTDTGTSFNRYNYAINNPYRFTDPDGRDAQWIEKKDGSVVLQIKVHFTGADATPARVAAVEKRVESLKTGNPRLKVDLVPLPKVGGVGTNTMDLSKGLDQKNYPGAGEGINQLGGNTGHIDTSPGRDATSAIAHDVLHFAGISDGYKEGPKDANGNRTSTQSCLDTARTTSWPREAAHDSLRINSTKRETTGQPRSSEPSR